MNCLYSLRQSKAPLLYLCSLSLSLSLSSSQFCTLVVTASMVFMSAGIWAVSHGAGTREDIRQELNITAAQYEKNSAYRDIWDDMQKRVSPFLISYVIINTLSLSLHVYTSFSYIYFLPSPSLILSPIISSSVVEWRGQVTGDIISEHLNTRILTPAVRRTSLSTKTVLCSSSTPRYNIV